MLLAETTCLFGSPVFEIQGFFVVFCLRAEKIIARCEERLMYHAAVLAPTVYGR